MRTPILALLACAALAPGCGGGSSSPPRQARPETGPFLLTSDAGVDGGTLPVEYTGDGDGVSPALSWSGAPRGTREFALLMSTLPGDGTTKWNWVLYGIPASATHLDRDSSGVGVAGVGSDGPTTGYRPPFSQGPGPRLYTFTLYALSASPGLPAAPGQVTGAVLARAIAPLTIGSAALDLTYERKPGPGPGPAPGFTIEQSISDGAQRTTLAFAGLAMMTGNLEAQSFFPPGKVADYTGFQHLRDNDPDRMGHNTSFLTRVANNVIHILDDAQFARLQSLATGQLARIDLYGYRRFALMKAFRRAFEGDIPAGSTGLNLNAVKKASRELYLIDGEISFDRALLYAEVLASMDSTQRAYLDAMKGKGWNSWPDVTNDQIRDRMAGLPRGTSVAVMTYAGDLFSWYAGSVEADVYFCPERHGTYFGSFYIKDAPAVGHEGYGIDEQLTATAGAALCDSSKGYVTAEQAAVMSSLVDIQRNNLYAAGDDSIVGVRTRIATRLRGLLASTAGADAVRAEVLALSETYGDLDGENNHAYIGVFTEVHGTLSAGQRTRLADLRKSIMSGAYSDGTPFDYSVCTTPFLYSAVITDTSVLSPYVDDTDYLFFEP